MLTLESADRPYRVLVESMQQGALTLSADGTILVWQPAHRRLAGAAPRRVGRAGPARPGTRRAAARLRLPAPGGPGRGAQGEALFAKRDGTTVPVHLAVSPLPVVGSAALCALVTDLTERKSFEQLQLAQAALRESEERLRLLRSRTCATTSSPSWNRRAGSSAGTRVRSGSSGIVRRRCSGGRPTARYPRGSGPGPARA